MFPYSEQEVIWEYNTYSQFRLNVLLKCQIVTTRVPMLDRQMPVKTGGGGGVT